MSETVIPGGIAHKLPKDLSSALLTNKEAVKTWQEVSPLARNEWICWVESVKKEETRASHIKRAVEDLKKGKRRPCCWMGCVHRKDKN